MLVYMLTNLPYINLMLEPLLTDCKYLIKTFLNCIVSHVYRESNRCADSLEKNESFTWYDHGFKNRTGHRTIFFFNFRFNPSVWPVFRFLTGCWPVFGVLTGPDWLRFPVEPVGPASPVRFLKQWIWFLYFVWPAPEVGWLLIKLSLTFDKTVFFYFILFLFL